MNDAQYTDLKGDIRRFLDIDIDAYKPKQMRRRLESFVGRISQDDVDGFRKELRENGRLLTDLRNMLTINVSEFFRDLRQFEHLRTEVLPEIAQRGHRINIWSAGCSRGQEPYTLAMMLEEVSALERSRILATDLDREALDWARAGGPYPKGEVRGIPAALLRKHFDLSDGSYWINEDVRRRIAFRELNLLSDEFQKGFDMIVCRNVMIYFSDEVKTDLFRRFHEALKPSGVLFIGGSEALLGPESTLFERMSGNFYRRAAVTAGDSRPIAVVPGR